MFRRQESTILDVVLDKAIYDLNNHAIGSPEYAKTLNAVATLHQIKEEGKPKSMSKDTILVVAGNILGILMIIHHEQLHPITSRALNLLLKPR
jgi:hypothetical protein